MNNKIIASHLFIEATRKCNLQCKHCMRGEMQDSVMTKEIVDKIFTEICDCTSVSIAGGEPLLALDMIEYITDKIIDSFWNTSLFQITTNGTIIDSKVIEILKRLRNAKENCRVLLRISGDEFHDYEVVKLAFEKYTDMAAGSDIQIKLTDEITMFEYSGRGKQYIKETQNPQYIQNIVTHINEKHYIKYVNNTVYCPLTISSNGNISIFSCGKEYTEIDNKSLGNILNQRIDEMILSNNKKCLLSCLEYENILFVKSSLLRFNLIGTNSKNEDYFSDLLCEAIFDNVLNARKEAQIKHPNLDVTHIINSMPLPTNTIFSICDIMNSAYCIIEKSMGNKKDWVANYLSNTDGELYKIFLNNKSSVGMIKWLCVIAATLYPDSLSRDCQSRLCKEKYLKYVFSNDISSLPEFKTLENIGRYCNTNKTPNSDNIVLPCGKTLMVNSFCVL